VSPAGASSDKQSESPRGKVTKQVSDPVYQGDMFASIEPSAVEEALMALDLDGLSPRDAINQLYELKELMRK